MFEDQNKQQAIFITQSFHETNNIENQPIDLMTLLKVVLTADAKLI
jgi:hypothetical protein